VTSESDLESQCRALVKVAGGEFLKIQGTRGWPDRLVLLPNGRHFFVELKRPGGELDLLQKYTLRLLRDLNHEAFELDNVALMKRLIRERS